MKTWKNKTFAAWNNSEDIRRISSSGGVFFEFCKKIIAEDGMVVGAAFDKNFNVNLEIVDNLKGIRKLCGSKYAQASVNGVFRQIKEKLHEGKKVLFSGTPCQCNALMSYLGNDDGNLFLVDLICHGVPTKGVWERYYSNLSHKKKVVNVSFRDKRNGWDTYGVSVTFEDGSEKYVGKNINSYLQLFLNNVILRPSCYYCGAKDNNRRSDITIGDFWGYMGDNVKDLGCSAIIVNTEKGSSFLQQITGLTLEEKDFDDLLKYNRFYRYSAPLPYKRSEFFKDFRNGIDVFDTYSEYYSSFLGQRILGKIKKEAKRMILLSERKKYISVLRSGKSIKHIKELCVGCSACSNVCDVGAITMQKDEEGAEYPVFDKLKCINCKKCEKVCILE